MASIGLLTTTPVSDAVTHDATPRTAGLAVHVEQVSSRPLLVLPGGVRNSAPDAFGKTIAATVDGAYDATSHFYTLSRIEAGDVVVPGTATYSLAENARAERNVLTWTNGAVSFGLTVSRLTPALRVATAQSALRLFGGGVTKRVITGGVIGQPADADSDPKWIAYPSGGGVTKVPLSGTAHTFGAFSAPWALVWWGARSHFCETSRPTTYSYPEMNGTGAATLRYSDAYQADAPMLLVFENTPVSVQQPASGKGAQFAWSGAAGSVVVLPLYGREHPAAAVTEAWGTGTFPAALQTRCAFWSTRLYDYPETVTTTRGTTASSATVTETFAYTAVRPSGGTRWAPIRPMHGIARHAGWNALSFSGAVVDGACPTEFGPSLGVEGTGAYSWTLAGLDAYTAPRAAPGVAGRDAALQSELHAYLAQIVAAGHLKTWQWGDRTVSNDAIGDVIGANPADTRWLLAEALALVTDATLRSSFTAYLASEETAYPLASTFRASEASGHQRVRGAIVNGFVSQSTRAAYLFQGAVTTWNAWALARQHQEAGTTPTNAQLAALAATFTGEEAETDWATCAPFNTFADRPASVEDVNRRCAGLLGLYWLAQHAPTPNATTAADALAAFARTALLRVAMAHYPRWLAAAGGAAGALLSYPNDPGDLGTDWQPELLADKWPGFIQVEDWQDAGDDPRQVLVLNQFQCFLHDSTGYRGWANGLTNAYAVAYRHLTPPVAALLSGALGAEALIYHDKFVAMTPHWHAPWAYGSLGQEFGTLSPLTQHQMWCAEAWLAGTPAGTLLDRAGVSLLTDGTDEPYVHRLAETLRVQSTGGGPTVTITSAPATVAQWGKWEATFSVAGGATGVGVNVYYPHDAAPPAGQSRVGVTIDLLLSGDGWTTTEKPQPCFWYEGYDYTASPDGSGRDHWYPDGDGGTWMARFAPPTAGAWAYRFRATDASGTSLTAPATFTATASAAPGHLRVAQSDARYIERSDGTYFPNIGLNPHGLSRTNPVSGNLALLDDFAANGVHALRFWLDGWSPFGAYWTPWRPANGGDNAAVAGTNANHVDTGGDVSLDLWRTTAAMPDAASSPYAILGWNDPALAVKPSTTYVVTARIKIPRPLVAAGAGARGFTIKLSDTWITETVHQVGVGTLLSGALGTPITTTSGFQTFTGTFTTGAGQYFVNFVYAVMQNCIDPDGGGSNVAVDSISIKEQATGLEVCPMPSWQTHQYVKQAWAWRFDQLLQQCEARGITLSLVLLDKLDNVLNGLDIATGVWNGLDNSGTTKFYGPASFAISRSRWLQRAWWRYCQARWGYSSAVHSWELLNEGTADPTTGHAHLAELFAQYMASFSNAHMTTTSFGNGFPQTDWLANPAFGSLSFNSVHQYVDKTNALSLLVNHGATSHRTVTAPGDMGDTHLANTHLANEIGTFQPYGTGNLGAPKPVVRGEWGLVNNVLSTTDDYTHDIYADLKGVWLHKFEMANLGPAGVMSWYWFDTEHVYPDGIGDDPPATFLPIFKRLHDIVSALPLNNGHYTDAGATVGAGGTNLRKVGQKDTVNGRVHLWLDNATDTSAAVIAGTPPTAVPAGTTVTIPGMPPGTYRLTWRTVNRATGAVTVTDGGTVTVT